MPGNINEEKYQLLLGLVFVDTDSITFVNISVWFNFSKISRI